MAKKKSVSQIRKKRGRKDSRSLKSIVFRTVLRLSLITVILGGIAFCVTYYYLKEDLPKITSLSDYRPPTITTVYSDDGRKIAEFYKERRIVIPLAEIPQMLINAFVAAEDARFYKHKGIDMISVAFYDVRAHEPRVHGRDADVGAKERVIQS